MAHFLSLVPVEHILDRIREFSPLAEERVPLEAAAGRVLARALAAPEDVPGFDRSTMDGFAVRARDVFGASEGLPALLEFAGECPMGERPAFGLGPGQTARIWTGGMLPEGADAVVMLEYARAAGTDRVELCRPVAPQENVILKGEDVRIGQELLPAGRRLRPQEIGLLAALGQREIPVRAKPKAAVISSGDEVLPVECRPGPGQVRDINAYSLAALVQEAGGEARILGLTGDDPERLRALVAESLDFADTVLLSGGSSAGQRDYTLKVLKDMPGSEILAHGVAISPGKPLIMARTGNACLWGLPGHPASALVCAEVFVRPLLRRYLGQPEEKPAWAAALTARLTRPVPSAQGRRDYIRVALEAPETPGGPLRARPVLGKSGLISTLVLAEALVVCPENQEGLSAGEEVPVHLLL